MMTSMSYWLQLSKCPVTLLNAIEQNFCVLILNRPFHSNISIMMQKVISTKVSNRKYKEIKNKRQCWVNIFCPLQHITSNLKRSDTYILGMFAFPSACCLMVSLCISQKTQWEPYCRRMNKSNHAWITSLISRINPSIIKETDFFGFLFFFFDARCKELINPFWNLL